MISRRTFCKGLVAAPLLKACGPYEGHPYAPKKASSFIRVYKTVDLDDGPFDSIPNYVNYVDYINACVTACSNFERTFGWEVPHCKIHVTEDYVFWYKTWAAGAQEGDNLFITMFTRGTSDIDPGDQFLKRKPGNGYSYWRYTAHPLLPAIEHEMLHMKIGDQAHSSPLWSLININSRKSILDTSEPTSVGSGCCGAQP